MTAWRDRLASLDRRHVTLSNGRLLLAALLALALWFTFVRPALSPWWPIAAGVAFAALAIVHARVLERIERARGAERVYLRGLERLNGRWAGTGRDGAHFIGDHPYARDLDLFGRASLFVYWIHVELVYGYASWLWRHRLPLWVWLLAFAAFTALMYRAIGWRDRFLENRRRRIPAPVTMQRA